MPIHYEVDDHVATITIDRPDTRNALDMYHFRDLARSWRRFKDDPDAWVAIITGVEDAYCVGADLKSYIPQVTALAEKIGSGEVTEVDGCRLTDGTYAVLRNVELYKPIVAAVNGPCVAGGMEMLGGVDIRIASPNAIFGVMEPKRGLFAGRGTTVRLPRQVAFPAAMEFLLTAEAFPAQRALELGRRHRRGRIGKHHVGRGQRRGGRFRRRRRQRLDLHRQHRHARLHRRLGDGQCGR